MQAREIGKYFAKRFIPHRRRSPEAVGPEVSRKRLDPSRHYTLFALKTQHTGSFVIIRSRMHSMAGIFYTLSFYSPLFSRK